MKINDRSPTKRSLFAGAAPKSHQSKFISTYRVALVRDRSLPFEQCRLMNSQQTQPIIRKLIETHGQSDREQFCVLLLNAKNKIIGLNIVSTGSVSSAPVAPRDVIKVAILANSAAIILSHNHPLCKAQHKGCYAEYFIMLSNIDLYMYFLDFMFFLHAELRLNSA